MSTYTLILLVDGERVGGSDENTLEDVNYLMECVMCPHDVCPSVRFMEDLYENNAAVLVTSTDATVGVSVAYLNES